MTDLSRWESLAGRASGSAAHAAAQAARVHRGQVPRGVDPGAGLLIGATPRLAEGRSVDLTGRGPEDDSAWLAALARRLDAHKQR